MKTSHLQLKPEDCSAIGLLVLEYMKKHQLDFTAMADKIGVSRAALRIACYREGTPGRRMMPQLAEVLGKSEQELLRLDAENKLRFMHEGNDEQ